MSRWNYRTEERLRCYGVTEDGIDVGIGEVVNSRRQYPMIARCTSYICTRAKDRKGVEVKPTPDHSCPKCGWAVKYVRSRPKLEEVDDE